MAAKYAKKSPAYAKKLANELHAQLTETVEALVTSDAWPKLLKTMAQRNGTEIGRYSFQNMLLVLSQCPEATAVCSFKAWVERGRASVKGSKSLRIYAPMTLREKDRDGNVRKTEDGKDRTRVGFRMIPVFDVSQTAPLWQDPCQGPMFITPSVGKPSIVKQLQGKAPEDMWDAVAEQIENLGYTIERGATGSAMGYTNPKNKTVRVSDGVSEAQAAKTLAHELAHILADHVSDLAAYREHRGEAETVAESVAYMISAYYGMDSVAYSAPYIGTWADKDPEKVMATVQATGKQVLLMFRKFVTAVESPELEAARLMPV